MSNKEGSANAQQLLGASSQNIQLSASQPMQTFVVSIGIDDYLGEDRLAGAVKDATSFAEFMEQSLCVPKENMFVLLDGDATRHNILETLYTKLRDNPHVRHGDAIIIYFAGHGTTYQTKYGCQPMEAIMPVDRGSMLPDGTVVLDISDRQLNLFLTELRGAKGGNITVIMDCCHSAGCTRGASQSGPRTARTRPPLNTNYQDIVLAAENDPWKRWSPRSATDAKYQPDTGSHVLIAACRANELAGETVDGGVLTQKLLILLRSFLDSMTYDDLQKLLDGINFGVSQHPVVIGHDMYKACRLFKIHTTAECTPLYRLQMASENLLRYWCAILGPLLLFMTLFYTRFH